ncbi:WD domain-containing protein [Histoplasma ohiense]|nr:WD domain-containing protein [Histoplasma ohiense (nom. inval.)]
MSQHATPADGEKSVAPMKARRGGISLGGRQKLSRSELLRQPGTIRFAPYSAHHRKVPSMDTFNTTIQQTLEAPGMWDGVSTNQPNADAQSEPLRNFSPEPDLDGKLLDEKAQSLLDQFLRTSSTRSLNKVDSGIGPERSCVHVQPSNGLKRTADGQFKNSFLGEDILSQGNESCGSRSDSSLFQIAHSGSDKRLPERAHNHQTSSTVKNTVTTTTSTPTSRTSRTHFHSQGGSTSQDSTSMSQNDVQNLKDKHNTIDHSTISHSSNPPGISNSQTYPTGIATTFPSSVNSSPVVVLPPPSIREFAKPELPASSTLVATKHREKSPKKKPGPKLKTKALTMSQSDSGSSYVPSDASSSTIERRTRRNRSGPANYYAKVRGFPGYESGEDEEEMEEQANPEDFSTPRDDATQQTTHELLNPVPEPTVPLIRSIYCYGYLQVLQEPLPAPVDELFEEYAPYSSQHDRTGFGERCASENLEKDDPEGRVIHADFDQSEMEALFHVMTRNLATESDIALPDLLIQTTRKFYPHRDQQKALAQKISYLNALRKCLLKITNDPVSFLLHHRDERSSWREGDNKTPQRGTIRQILFYLHIVLGFPPPPNRVYHVHDILQSLRQINKDDFQYLLSVINCFKHRRRRHVCALLSDAADGLLSSAPYLLRAISSHAFNSSPDFECMKPSALLRERELGQKAYRRKTPIYHNIQSRKSLELWKEWKGASNDVMVLAWSSDGTRFAAGAAAQSDEHNMIYNRNNNLLLGDLTCNSLKELPDHRVRRPIPNNVTDPNLYMTVSAVSWRGETLYTASYDNTVKIWDVSTHTGAKCVNTLPHCGRVMVMAVSNSGSIATGCDSAPHIKLWTKTSGHGYIPDVLICNPTRNVPMIPSSLAWGTQSADNILVAGLAAREDEKFRNGHLAVWQMGESTVSPLVVSPNSQNVFDVTWHPTARIFATGSTVESSPIAVGRAKTIRSLVRVYDPFRPKATWGAHITYECPALDINDVTFCPADSNYITASCTDGVTYVWDYRSPGRILHRLAHGAPISELDSNVSREQHDTGVRLALWKNNWVDQFYTGGSDGVLKKWNILRAPEDVLVENTAYFDQGIMSGAFSPDFTNLLIGDSCGSIHVLSSAPFSHGDINMAYEPVSKERNLEDDGDDKLGIKTAKELLSSGKLRRHPVFGVGQGPRYDGPYASWARQEGTPKEALARTPLLPEIQATQLDGSLSLRHQLEREDKKQLDLRIQGAIAQNQQRGRNKRKGSHDMSQPSIVSSSTTSLSSPFSPSSLPSRVSSFSPSIFGSHKHSEMAHQYISLLSSDDESEPSSARPSSSARIKSEFSLPTKLDSPACIDLTGDSEDEAQFLPPPPPQQQQQQDEQAGVLSSIDENVDWPSDQSEDDYWWPRNCDVDPNLRGDGA